jgi:hypothetical protein
VHEFHKIKQRYSKTNISGVISGPVGLKSFLNEQNRPTKSIVVVMFPQPVRSKSEIFGFLRFGCLL